MKKSKVTVAKRTLRITAWALAAMLLVPAYALADQTGIVTATKAVNVRSAADQNANAIATVSPDTKVTVKGSEKDSDGTLWYQVDYNGGSTGYIRGDLLKVTEVDTSANTDTNNGNADANKAAGDGNAAAPSTEGNTGAATPATTPAATTPAATTPAAAATPAADAAGATATKSNTVSKGNSVVTDVANGEVPAGVTSMTPTSLKVKSNNTNLRSQASTSSGKVTTLSSGTGLTAYGTIAGSDSKTWYYVIVDGSGNTQGGFVREDVVTVGSPVVGAGGAADGAAAASGADAGAGAAETVSETAAETESEVATGPVTSYGNADYEIVPEVDENGNEVMYLYDNVDGKKVKIQELLTYINGEMDEKEKTASKLRNLKILCIVLGVLAAVLAGLLIFMKVREGYDDDYDDGYGPQPARAPQGQKPQRESRDSKPSREADPRRGGTRRPDPRDGAGRGPAPAGRPRGHARNDDYDDYDERGAAAPVRENPNRAEKPRRSAPPREDERRPAPEDRTRAPRGGERPQQKKPQQNPARRSAQNDMPERPRKQPREVPDDDLDYEFLDLDGDKKNV